MNGGTSREPCVLPWDSSFFAMPIGRVWAPLDAAAAHRAFEWAEQHGVACTYLLVPAHDLETRANARRVGFRCVDTRVTLDTDPRRARDGQPSAVREAVAGDVGRLRTLAYGLHHDTRFAVDRRFPRDRVRELYATWIVESRRGQADAVLVADAGRGVVGYVTCHLDEPGVGRIGLVGVAPGSRGLGIGRQLLAAALGWFRHRAQRVSVATQARNAAALALYRRAGFRTAAVEVWLHRWRLPRVTGGAP